MNTALFWQTYLSNYPRFIFMAIFGMAAFLLLNRFFFRKNDSLSWAYWLGFIRADPFNYYWTTYINLQ